MFLSTGMFIRYFQHRKSIKKSKIIKVIIAKYLRKFLLILKMKFINLYFNSSPVMLQELLSNLTSPLVQPLKNPLTSKSIDESFSNKTNLNFIFFFFQKSIPFGKFKARRKGRIKRKILRRLIKVNNVID